LPWLTSIAWALERTRPSRSCRCQHANWSAGLLADPKLDRHKHTKPFHERVPSLPSLLLHRFPSSSSRRINIPENHINGRMAKLILLLLSAAILADGATDLFGRCHSLCGKRHAVHVHLAKGLVIAPAAAPCGTCDYRVRPRLKSRTVHNRRCWPSAQQVSAVSVDPPRDGNWSAATQHAGSRGSRHAVARRALARSQKSALVCRGRGDAAANSARKPWRVHDRRHRAANAGAVPILTAV